jgi:hypothetical protein
MFKMSRFEYLKTLTRETINVEIYPAGTGNMTTGETGKSIITK